MRKRTYQGILEVDVGEKVCKQRIEGRMNHTYFWNLGSDLADELPSPIILAADLSLLNAECSTRVTALSNL